MPDEETQTRQCPYCKEEVNAEAVRCKHCQAAIPQAMPAHHGVCPYCKEAINPEAVRCKHCHANLAPSAGEQAPATTIRAVRSPAVGAGASAPRRALARSGRGIEVLRDELFPDPVPGCHQFHYDSQGTWCFIEASEHYCIYELCGG